MDVDRAARCRNVRTVRSDGGGDPGGVVRAGRNEGFAGRQSVGRDAEVFCLGIDQARVDRRLSGSGPVGGRKPELAGFAGRCRGSDKDVLGGTRGAAQVVEPDLILKETLKDGR